MDSQNEGSSLDEQAVKEYALEKWAGIRPSTPSVLR